MRRFIDLHLRQPDDSVDELERMLRLAVDIGYSGVALSSNNAPRMIRGLCREMDLEIISRIDLRPRSTRELMAHLKWARRRFEIVAVDCHSKEVARQAAKDHRVDLLDFSSSVSTRSKVWFDRQEAVLASGANCAYEINLSDLILKGPAVTARLLSIVRREVENAKKHKVPIIISSGAHSCSLMREPRGLASLVDLVDIGEEESLEMISSIPWSMVEVNREKLTSGFVEPGVRVVGEDAG